MFFVAVLCHSLLIAEFTRSQPGFHYPVNATTTTQKQSDYKVEQSSFTLIALFWLEIGRCCGLMETKLEGEDDTEFSMD